jgi:ArsR family transcriptional regulator
MRQLADMFKGLADETRLRMLSLLLRHGELCVCDFEQVLKITQSKASRHLRYLLHAGLLQDRRDGVWVHYRMRKDLSPQVLKLLKSAEPILEQQGGERLSRQMSRWLAHKKRTGTPCRTKTAAGDGAANKN